MVANFRTKLKPETSLRNQKHALAQTILGRDGALYVSSAALCFTLARSFEFPDRIDDHRDRAPKSYVCAYSIEKFEEFDARAGVG